MYILLLIFFVFTISNNAPHLFIKSLFSNYSFFTINKRIIIATGNINPDIKVLKVPKANPKISPFIENSAVLMLRNPNIIKSIKPSIDIDNIGLKNKLSEIF